MPTFSDGCSNPDTPSALATADLVDRAAFFELTPVATVVHSDGVVLLGNAAAAHLLGFDRSSALASYQLREVLADEASIRLFGEQITLQGNQEHGDSSNRICLLLKRKAAGPLRAWATSAQTQWQGQPAILTTFVENSEQIRNANDDLVVDQPFKDLLDSCASAIGLTDRITGKVLWVNNAFCDLIGYERKDLIGKTSVELNSWPKGETQRLEGLSTLKKCGDTVALTLPLNHADGSVMVLHYSITVVGTDDAQKLLTTAVNVTDYVRRQAEFDAVLANAPVAIVVTDGDVIRSASPWLNQLIGIPGFNAAGVRVKEMWRGLGSTVYGEHQAKVKKQLAANRRAKFLSTYTRPDGKSIQLRVEGSPLSFSKSDRLEMVWTLTDVTAEMEAFHAREVAEASSRAKSAFLAMMSHELRTPLNGILGLAELAQSPEVKPADRKLYLSHLSDCAGALSNILNDVLDLSKIEAGRMEYLPEAVNPHVFFQRIRSTYSVLSDSQGLEFRFTIDPTIPNSILIDPTRLRQILVNFISNALKFTQKGFIEVAAKRIEDRLHISVLDSGQGIPVEMLPRLFNPFEQAHDTARSQSAGTGLGLAICNKFAHLMGGEVGAESEPGRGSCFWLDLPIQRPDAQAVARAHREHKQLNADLHGVRVLLAEDNEVNALITMRFLASAGAQSQRVVNGLEAIDAVEAAFIEGRPYDVVLMDVQMPLMDGLLATRELRTRDCGRGLRIVALTAGALAEQRSECLRAGMQAFLPKPLHRDRMLAEVLLQSKLAHHAGNAEEFDF